MRLNCSEVRGLPCGSAADAIAMRRGRIRTPSLAMLALISAEAMRSFGYGRSVSRRTASTRVRGSNADRGASFPALRSSPDRRRLPDARRFRVFRAPPSTDRSPVAPNGARSTQAADASPLSVEISLALRGRAHNGHRTRRQVCASATVRAVMQPHWGMLKQGKCAPAIFTATHTQSRQFQKSKSDTSPIERQCEVCRLDDPSNIVRY